MKIFLIPLSHNNPGNMNRKIQKLFSGNLLFLDPLDIGADLLGAAIALRMSLCNLFKNIQFTSLKHFMLQHPL